MREPQRRQSSPTTMGKLQRHSSRQKMDDLQREVDLALEFFSQEEENELDHFDGDDYLHRHGKYQRGEKVRFMAGGLAAVMNAMIASPALPPRQWLLRFLLMITLNLAIVIQSYCLLRSNHLPPSRNRKCHEYQVLVYL